MKPKRIICDVDGVLCDVVSPLLKEYNQRMGTFHAHDDVKNYGFDPLLPGVVARYVFHEKHFWMNRCLPYVGAAAFVRMVIGISDHHPGLWFEIISQPNGSGLSHIDKAQWLDAMGFIHQRAFPSSGKPKTDLFEPNDIIIDDSPDILTFAKNNGMIPVCIDRPWNQPDSNPGWSGLRFDYSGAIQHIDRLG